MKFHELCKLTYPLLRCRCKNKCELFDFFVIGCIDGENEKLKKELEQLSKRQKENIVNGTTPFASTASKIFGCYTGENIEQALEESISEMAIEDYLPTLAAYFPEITDENYISVISDAYHTIVKEGSSEFKNKTIVDERKLKEDLLDECDYKCPKCGAKITEDDKCVSIDSSKGKEKVNLIMLCGKCNSGYESGYLKEILPKLKKQLIDRKCSPMPSISIDMEMMDAIKNLLDTITDDSVKLNLTGLKIDKKIESGKYSMLLNKVKTNVSLYFPILNEFFHETDGENNRSFEKLAATMRAMYLQLDEKTDDKEEIFEMLVDDIKAMATCKRSIAEVLVSYFIQDCEVFDEIPE